MQQDNPSSGEQPGQQQKTTPTAKPKKRSKAFLATIAIVGVIVLVGGAAVGYMAYSNWKEQRTATTEPTPTPEPSGIVETMKEAVKDLTQSGKAVANEFATYKDVPVNVKPSVPEYTVKSDLSNVTNASQFFLSDDAMALLAKNAFVVVPNSASREFFPLYEQNRYGFVPNFVTTDSVMHNYHLMFDHILKRLEETALEPELRTLNDAMLTSALEQYETLKGTPWENAAKRNVGFFTVGSVLLDDTTPIASIVQSEVQRELALIEAHAGPEESLVMNIGRNDDGNDVDPLFEDYSQYVPRGHYTKSDQLKNYFRSMMWYGRLSFRVKSTDEMRSAVLITLLLNKPEHRTSWDSLFEPINFFVGKSDDITYYQMEDVLRNAYGANATVETVMNDSAKFDDVLEAMKTLEPPKINSMPIFAAEIQPNREEEIKAFRYMGQRFTIDASIFQQLICRDVGNKRGTMECPTEDSRMLPKSLDVAAAFGSAEAEEILTDLGEKEYKNYPENLEKIQRHVDGLHTSVWTQNLYWGWLYSLRPLLDEKGAGYPSFMRNQAWVRKGLNTFLGSWTELKHDTILYAKQAYAELGAGGPEEADDRGYVEPEPELYARLAGLLRMTIEGLDDRDILTPEQRENLEIMETLALSLKTISEKELNNEKLTNEEYELIRTYGGQLEHLWLEVNKEEMEAKGLTQADLLIANPAALVADVATDPNGQVLEEATGHIFPIYVVVPIDGKLRIASGGVFSYYEFPWPIGDRLTDEKWREILDSVDAGGEIPDRPEWTKSFISNE